MWAIAVKEDVVERFDLLGDDEVLVGDGAVGDAGVAAPERDLDQSAARASALAAPERAIIVLCKSVPVSKSATTYSLPSVDDTASGGWPCSGPFSAMTSARRATSTSS